MTQWPRYSLEYICRFLSHHIMEQTATKFNDLLALGENLRVYAVRRVSERSHTTANCHISTVWHISIAYFSIILFLDHCVWDYGFEIRGLIRLLFLLTDIMNELCPLPSKFVKITRMILKKIQTRFATSVEGMNFEFLIEEPFKCFRMFTSRTRRMSQRRVFVISYEEKEEEQKEEVEERNRKKESKKEEMKQRNWSYLHIHMKRV